jgi:ferredoxin
MAHIVTGDCKDCKNTVCVEVCPVDCFHEGDNILVIDPFECIDCGACIPECPEEAIFLDVDLPKKWEAYTKINETESQILPVIAQSKDPLNSRSDCKG